MLKPVEQAFTTKVEQNAIYDETKADEKKKIDWLQNMLYTKKFPSLVL